jgi:hypothetical protein
MNIKNLKIGETVLATGSVKQEASKGIMWIRDFNRALSILDPASSEFEESELVEIDRLLNKLDHFLVKVEKLG